MWERLSAAIPGVVHTIGAPKGPPTLLFAEDDPRFRQIVGREFHLYLVARNDPDEVLPHLAGDVRQHVTVSGKIHAKHRAG